MIWRMVRWSALAGGVAVVAVLVVCLHDLPEAKAPVAGGTVSILDLKGREIAVYGGPGARAVPIERLPDYVIDAVLATVAGLVRRNNRTIFQ